MTRDEEIFSRTIELPPAERAGFVLRECGDDQALRHRVEALLRGHERAAGFLRQPLSARTLIVPAELPSARIGPYKLLEKIGEGGCGLVYLAEQLEPVRRRVALKLIKLGMDTNAVVARFEAERQALAMMEHPNIAKVFDAGAAENGRPYFAMELVRGAPITEYCDRNRLAVGRRIELFLAVCSAVGHAHEKGVVHRDLKPSNILVSAQEGAAVPKVIDFGVAKATRGFLTERTLHTAVEQFLGTPAYMSPEQADLRDGEVGASSDLYALGVLLYELLCGRTPFDGGELARAGLDEMRRRIREVEPTLLSLRLRALPEAERVELAKSRDCSPGQLEQLLRGDLDWIVMRCLEKDPTRRYRSAGALAEDLRRHLDHQPVSARAPRALYRAGKWARRHRSRLAAGAAVAAALALGAGIDVFRARRPASPAEARTDVDAAPAVDDKSIVVLPFESLSEDKDNAFFAAGVREEVLTDLTHARDLRVISSGPLLGPAPASELPGRIGRTLGAAYLVEGSVRRAGGKVRVTAKLIRTATGEQLWAEPLDGEMSDVFALQSELARKIAASLQATLSPRDSEPGRRPTESADAYNLYLKAMGGRRSSVPHLELAKLFRAAVALDPKFALAWAGLAVEDANIYSGDWDHSEERLQAAQAAMDTALRLDPDDPEVIRALADYAFHGYRDYARSIEQYRRLASLLPNDPGVYAGLGYVQRHQGRWVEAAANFRQARRLDPGNLQDVLGGLAATLIAGRRYDELQALFRELAASGVRTPIESLDYGLAYLPFLRSGSTTEMEAYLSRPDAGSTARRNWAMEQGRLDEAIRLSRELLSQSPGSMPDGPPIPGCALLAAAGEWEEARGLAAPALRSLRARLEREPANYLLWAQSGQLEAILGHREEAVRLALRAVELMPESADAQYGPIARGCLAFVYAWTGDVDRAIAEYTHLLRVPAMDTNVHAMRRAAYFHPLQADPRFRALLDDPANNAPLF